MVLGPLTTVAGAAGLSVCVVSAGWLVTSISGSAELGASVLGSGATGAVTGSGDLLEGASLAGLHCPLDFLTCPSVDFTGDFGDFKSDF